jgi:hypothetical protein
LWPVRLDHDAADVAGDDRVQHPDRVHVLAGVGEVCAAPAVEPAAVDDQRLVAVVQRRPLDRLPLEVKLGNALGDPVQQLEAVLVAFIDPRHRGIDSGGGVRR